MLLTSLFGSCLMGGFASFLATKRGRNPITWGLLGFLGGLISCFILIILPNRKALPIQDLTSTDLQVIIWYYIDHNHVQHGPVSYQRLLAHEKNISFIWNENMKDWAPWK